MHMPSRYKCLINLMQNFLQYFWQNILLKNVKLVKIRVLCYFSMKLNINFNLYTENMKIGINLLFLVILQRKHIENKIECKNKYSHCYKIHF